jgi:hypothetical protein
MKLADVALCAMAPLGNGGVSGLCLQCGGADSTDQRNTF